MDMVKTLFRQRDTQLTRIPECDANGTVYVTGPGGALNVDVLSVIPGVGATNLGKAEDAAHTSGDTGVMGLAVRQDAAAALGANGDYMPLIVDEDGKLWVRLDSDIEIGAVELKDATTAQRAIIDAAGQLQVTAIAGAIVDGGDVTQGTTTDAAIVTDAVGTVSGKLRGLVKWAFERMPASLGQKTKAASLPVTLASDEDAVPVSIVSGAGTITKTNATGAAAIATSAAIAAGARLISVTVHFDIAPVAAGDYTVTLNANAGGAYDTLLYSVDPSVGSVTDIVYVPDGPLYLENGDAIDVVYANANTRTYGVQITTEAV